MTNFTELIGRLGKTLGIGTGSTTEPTASDSAPASDEVAEPARPSTEADAARSTIAGD